MKSTPTLRPRITRAKRGNLDAGRMRIRALRASARIAGAATLLLAALATGLRADREQVLQDLARIGAEHRDSTAWDRRRSLLRKEFLKGAGLWPLPKRGPYSVVRHSLRQYDGYTVENV